MLATLRRASVMVAVVIASITTAAITAQAHPMPHSVVLLDVHDDRVRADLEIPLVDLGLAVGLDLQADPGTVVDRDGDVLARYLHDHIAVTGPSGVPWTVELDTLTTTEAEQTSTGPYQELAATAVLTPPPGESTRSFTLDYDVVVHQVVTHTILVSVRQDWSSGTLGTEDPVQVGVIRTDTRTGEVPALAVDLSQGSVWDGFASMLTLGMSHIREGTDHMLFLLTLLLPAPLLVAGRRWGAFAGVRSSVTTIAKITLAFTVGHSATLVFASIGGWQLPGPPIEALIAVSILISALHAVRPLFPGREVVVAAGFGLVHGAAFSFTLAELDLGTRELLLSLLGFNLGIEVMQLFLVALILPSLTVLATSRVYTPIRVTGAVLVAVAAIGWLVDRLGRPNPIATGADALGAYWVWLVVVLAIAAVVVLVRRRFTGRPPVPTRTDEPEPAPV